MSWEQLAEMDAFGTSRFQNLCCREVAKFLPDVKFEERGDTAKTFVADIPMHAITVCLYLDSAEILSTEAHVRLERSNFPTPEDLALQLIKELSNAF